MFSYLVHNKAILKEKAEVSSEVLPRVGDVLFLQIPGSPIASHYRVRSVLHDFAGTLSDPSNVSPPAIHVVAELCGGDEVGAFAALR